MDIIKFKDFVEVTVDKLTEVNLPLGSIVFVAGSQPVPEDENDPYNLRVKFIICPTKDGHIVSNKFLMIDPSSVKKVSTKVQNRLTSIMEEDFKKDEATN